MDKCLFEFRLGDRLDLAYFLAYANK
jgi:hypothetical protein